MEKFSQIFKYFNEGAQQLTFFSKVSECRTIQTIFRIVVKKEFHQGGLEKITLEKKEKWKNLFVSRQQWEILDLTRKSIRMRKQQMKSLNINLKKKKKYLCIYIQVCLLKKSPNPKNKE
eukprot:TRINITY_DN20853_c0_g1_i1.p2 TRINITY_DN20853_c0_g1~~TRINITY_DN20853_c0_g1_i1.p2  ORF type:complete len:119 (-),score=27.11 TRINITY_DN20853_c0_g1_i1:113-469(-)